MSFENLFETYPDGLHYEPMEDQDISAHRLHEMFTAGDRVTVDQVTFQKRFQLFSHGLCEGLDTKKTQVMLSGGSLNMLISRCFDEAHLRACDSDLDLFMSSNDDISDLLERVEEVLVHFAAYAKLHGLKIRYIVRGTLLEVMIQQRPRIQIICAHYPSMDMCIANLDLCHVQMYSDGKDVFLTPEARDALCHQQTHATRYPIKCTRVQKCIERGYSVRGPIFITQLDRGYYEGLDALEAIKSRIDAGSSPLAQDYDRFLMFKCIDRTMQETRLQATRKWDPYRIRHHRLHMFTFDLDIFDINLRIQTTESQFLQLKRFSWKDTQMENTQILTIDDQKGVSSPVVFVVKNVQVKGVFMCTQTYHDVFLEFDFDEPTLNVLKTVTQPHAPEEPLKALFIYGVSHSMQANGMIHNHILKRTKGVVFAVSFKILHSTAEHDPATILEIVELTTINM